MSRDLLIHQGDLAWKDGDFVIAEDKQEIAQCIETALGTNLGEFKLEPEIGIEYFNMLGKGVTDEDIQAEIYNGLSQEERVDTVSEIVITRDSLTRKANVFFSVTTDENEVIESEVTVDAG